MSVAAKGGTVFGPNGLRVVFDLKDSDTPVMVYLGARGSTYGIASATFEWANATGTVDDVELNKRQCDWLITLEDRANAVIDEARKDDPRYGS